MLSIVVFIQYVSTIGRLSILVGRQKSDEEFLKFFPTLYRISIAKLKARKIG